MTGRHRQPRTGGFDIRFTGEQADEVIAAIGDTSADVETSLDERLNQRRRWQHD